MPITIEVPELELKDLPEWCQRSLNPQYILEMCRKDLAYRANIFSAQSKQGQGFASQSPVSINSFPPLR